MKTKCTVCGDNLPDVLIDAVTHLVDNSLLIKHFVACNYKLLDNGHDDYE
jgi:hypothetical protein